MLEAAGAQAKYFAWELTRRRRGGDLDRIGQALFDAAVDLNPHQIEVALFALQNPLPKSVLLTDEVGLGKTIEPAQPQRTHVPGALVASVDHLQNSILLAM